MGAADGNAALRAAIDSRRDRRLGPAHGRPFLRARLQATPAEGTTQVGLYGMGAGLATAVAFGADPPSNRLGGPLLSRSWSARRPSGFTPIRSWSTFGSPACGGGRRRARSPEILRVLTTKAYYGAHSVVACLAFTYVFGGLTYIGSLGCSIAKRNHPMAIAVTVAAAVNVGLNWLLVCFSKHDRRECGFDRDRDGMLGLHCSEWLRQCGRIG